MFLIVMTLPFTFALLQNGDQCTQNSQCISTVCNLKVCIPVYPAAWESSHGPTSNTYAADVWTNTYWNLTNNTIQNAGIDTLNFGTSSIPPKVANLGISALGTNSNTNTVIMARTTQIYAYTMQGSSFSYIDSLDLNMTIIDFALVRDLYPHIIVLGQESGGRSVMYDLYLGNVSANPDNLKFKLSPTIHNPWNLTSGATTNFRYYALTCADQPDAPYQSYCGAIAGNITAQTSTVALFTPSLSVGPTLDTVIPRSTFANIAVRSLMGTLQDSTPTNPRAQMVYDGAGKYSFYAASIDMSRIVRLQMNASDTYAGYEALKYDSPSGWNGTPGIKLANPITGLMTEWPNTFFFMADVKNTGVQNPCFIYVDPIASAYQTGIVCMADPGVQILGAWGGGSGGNSIQYSTNSYVYGATTFRNNIGDVPIICQFTYVAHNSGSTHKHQLGCTQWNGASLTMGTIALFDPVALQAPGANYYQIGLDRTPNIVSFKPTQGSDTMLNVGNSLFAVNPSTKTVTMGYANITNQINKSRVIVANIGYGQNLELVAASTTSTKLLSAGYGSVIDLSQDYVPPTINTTLYTNGGFFGFYSTVCQGSTMTFNASECPGGVASSTCNYASFPGYQERLLVKCPTQSNFTIGNYSATTPSVSCFVPYIAGPQTVRVYLQSELDPFAYTTYADVNFTVAASNCGLPEQLIAAPGYTGPGGNQSPGGGNGGSGLGQGVVDPQDVVDDILGQTSFAWKLFIGLMLVLGSMAAAAASPAIHRSNHGGILIGAVGVLMFFFCSFIGLFPAYVLVVIGVMLTLGIIAWRVFFPNVSG